MVLPRQGVVNMGPTEKEGLAVILIGPPCSGKSTQARHLASLLRVAQISTGEILRERAQERDAVGPEIQKVMRAGGLVRDEVVNQLIAARLAGLDAARG